MSLDLLAERHAAARRPGPGGPGRRRALAEATDAWLAGLFAQADAAEGICLVAVGGHGRRELSPGSDLDLMVLHRGDPGRAAAVAERIWYPIWDAGVALDHSVRSVADARRMAGDDLKVLLGLLDARAVAGEADLVTTLRSAVYADWRAMAARRMADLRQLVEERRSRCGDLATMLEPDLKEAYGGLREATVLRAIAASWLTDIPHEGWEGAVEYLMNVRDALHAVTGRPGDALRLQEQDAVAQVVEVADGDELLRQVYSAARSVAYASDVTWHRVDRLTRRPSRFAVRSVRRRGSTRVPLAEGVVLQDGEVVLATEARPDRDPVLVLRAAAAAAQAALPLAPHAVRRLARESCPMPRPWPGQAREAFVSLLGAGAPTIAVWEALDQEGLISALIPGWEVVRSAPQRNAVHRFTVDRHLVETVVQASDLTRAVDRPDLLLVAALLHDIGKARGGDHSVIGARLVEDLAPMMGFSDEDAAIIVRLVRHHLLLPETATRRDLDDPATIDLVATIIDDSGVLDLLAALTQADALATGPGVWSDWRRSLVADLVGRVHAAIAGRPLPAPPGLTADQSIALAQEGVWVLVSHGADGCEVTVAAPDRVGLLSTVAGVLAIHRLQVRSARVTTVGARAAQVWTVEPTFGDPPTAERLAEDVRLALDGALDVTTRLTARDEAYRPRDVLRPAPRIEVVQSNDRSTILEVRAHDEPGLLYRITAAISAADAVITGAKVATLGSEVVDVFFLSDRQGGCLGEAHAQALSVTVMAALAEQIT